MDLSRERVAQLLKWLVPAAAMVCFVAWAFVAVRATHSWDDAEPEILNQAWRLSHGESIYRSIDEPPYVHTAYPPVYFGVVAILLKVTGLNYLPAKSVSLIAVLMIGWAISSIAKLWGREKRDAWWLLCLLLLLPAFFYNGTRAHVQMLAVAFSLISVAMFMKGGRTGLVASGLAAVLAVYTKQTQIAAPMAIICWLAFRDGRRLATYLGTILLAALPPLLWLQWETRGYFLQHVFELNRLPYSITDIPLVTLHWAGPLFLLIAYSIRAVWTRVRRRDLDVVDLYFGMVFLITVITCGRLGAHSQYVVELAVATLLVFLREWATEPWSNRFAQWQAILLLVYAPLFIFVEEGRFGIASNRVAGKVQTLLRSASGPVLSQQGSFPLFSHGEIPIQLFHFTALAREGKWDMNRLKTQVDERRFSWVVTEFPVENGQLTSDDLERFAPGVVNSLRANYLRAETLPPYFIYRPVSR